MCRPRLIWNQSKKKAVPKKTKTKSQQGRYHIYFKFYYYNNFKITYLLYNFPLGDINIITKEKVK